MDLRQLEYVVAVAEAGTFTAAATALHVAQPAVSAQVARLERELGTPVFVRTPRGAVPTDVGREVVARARVTLASAASVTAAAAEHTGLLRGTARLGVVPGCTETTVVTALGDLRARAPGVEVTLREGTAAALVDDVLAGALDVALVGLAGPRPAGLDGWVVTDDRLDLVVPPGHRWAGRRQLRTADLAEEPHVAMPPGAGLRTALDDAVAATGRAVRVSCEASDLAMVVSLVEAGLGVTLFPDSARAMLPAGVTVVRVVPEVRSRLEVVHAAPLPPGPAGRALVAALRRAQGLEPAERSTERAAPNR